MNTMGYIGQRFSDRTYGVLNMNGIIHEYKWMENLAFIETKISGWRN